MLELQRAKEIAGTVALPTNPDFFLVSLFCALAAQKRTTVSPVAETPLISYYKEIFSDHLSISQKGASCEIVPKEEEVPSPIHLSYNDLPYPAFIVFLLLGLKKTILFKDLPTKRLEVWQKQTAFFGYSLESIQADDATALTLSSMARL